MIAIGDNVRVFPHGSPSEAAIGKVLICSLNQLRIIVGFDGKPPFACIFNGNIALAVHPEFAVIFMAYREDIGPWIEITGGGHYEIETAEIRDGAAGKCIYCIRCGATSYDDNDVLLRYCGKCHRRHERTAVRTT